MPTLSDTSTTASAGDFMARMRGLGRPAGGAAPVAASRLAAAVAVAARVEAPVQVPTAGEPAPASRAMSALERMRSLATKSERPAGELDVDEDDDFPSRRSQGASPARELESVIGLVEDAKVFNGTWGVARIWTQDKTSLKVTGDIVGELKEGLSYEFRGERRTSSQHGESFVAVSARPHLDVDKRAITRFIAKSYKGVGEATASKFVAERLSEGAEAGQTEQEVLEALRQQLVNAPWEVDLSGVSRRGGGHYSGETNELMGEAVKRDLATRIGQLDGVREPVLKQLAAWLVGEQSRKRLDGGPIAGISFDLVQECWRMLATDPYAPLGKVVGYGFKSADAIGRSLNIPRSDEKRLAALSAYAISTECASGGHMYLSGEQALASIGRIDPSVDANAAVALGLAAERLRTEETAAGKVYYEAELHDVEHSLASRLAEMLAEPADPLSKKPDHQLRAQLQASAKRLNPNLANGLDPSQLDALVGILTSPSRLHTITAGPGCGKTSIMEVLTAHLGAECFDFCAPTGRAALVLNRRLAEVGGRATTIHSLFKGAGREFGVNEDNPLESRVLVVDEGSMPPASLWDAMLAGLARDQHVIVLGDVGQLPSIEPGRVLDDLLRIPQVDKHRLTSSHRAAGGLLEILGQIDRGDIDCKSREDVRFSHGLPLAANGFEAVAQEYVRAVEQYGFPQVALLMSRRKGDAATPDWNVTYANSRLREMCNPNAPKVTGTRFHINDRVIFRENQKVPRGTSDPEAEDSEEGGEGREGSTADRVTVVNGDTGTITDFVRAKSGPGSAGAKWFRVKLDDGRDVFYPVESAIDHAYAITVHSAQGGEYQRVIAVVTPGHASFVNRTMLRTQLSRARQLMTVHADDQALKRVAATPMPPRNSRLVELVKKGIEEGLSEDEPDADRACERDRCGA